MAENPVSSGYEKFAHNVALTAITYVILGLRGLILLPVIAKLLGASGYGIWAQAIVTLELVTPISRLGLEAALIRFLPAEKDKHQLQEGFYSILFVVLCSSVVFGLALLLLAPAIARSFFGGAEAEAMVIILATVIPLHALNSICLAYFQMSLQMKTFSLLTIALNLGEVALIAGLVLSGMGILGAILSLLIIRLLVASIALIIIVRRIGLCYPRFSNLKPYFAFGLPLLPTFFSLWVVEMSDRYVIGYFLGVASAGIYAAGYALGGFVKQFLSPLSTVLWPTVSKLYDENKMAEVRTHLSYSLKLFLLLAIPAGFGLTVLGKQLLQILATAEFVDLGPRIIPIVAGCMILFGVYYIGGLQVLVLVKQTNLLMLIWAIAAATNLGLNLIFIPRFGILAAAGSALVGYALACGITLYLASRHLTFKVYWGFILKSTAASAAMSVIILLLSPKQAWQVFASIGLGVIVYGATLLLLRGFKKEEIKLFKGLTIGYVVNHLRK